MSIISTIDFLNKNGQLQILVNNLVELTYNYDDVTQLMSISTIPSNINIPLDEWRADVSSIQQWINLLQLNFNRPFLPLTTSVKTFNKNPTRLNGVFSLETYSFDIRYNYSSKNIILLLVLTNTLSWSGFNNYISLIQEFLSNI